MLANHLLLMRPKAFGFNAETASSNAFQQELSTSSPSDIHHQALKEFDLYCQRLAAHGIKTLVAEDSLSPATPDAIFPNNWFASLPNQKVYTFPMQAVNRRLERRTDILERLSGMGYAVERSLESFEEEGLYLEGTGSMVMDHQQKLIFAAKSPRTSEAVLQHFAALIGYDYFLFGTTTEVYHTNVLMSVAPDFCLLCPDIIQSADRPRLNQLLEDKLRIDISIKQMENHFLGNCLMVRNQSGEKILLMSRRAETALSNTQKEMLASASITCLAAPIDTIETIGGGSARCMVAELF